MTCFPSFRSLPLLTTLSTSLLLAGCGALVQTPYTRPDTQTPAHWQNASTEPAATQDDGGEWWRNFNDTSLNSLMERVLQTNNDLAAATLRVRRAQLQAGMADTNLYPTVSASGSSNTQRNLRGDGTRSESYSVSTSISWEVDLWGRLESLSDAAEWTALATEQDRQATRLTLIGTTLQLYWQAALLNERIATARFSLEVAERTLELVQGQYRSGAVSGLEVAEAESTLASQRASLADLQRQRSETLTALSILTDTPPSQDVSIPESLPDAAPPSVQAGVPAELLGRRPDLRAAELRLRSTLASGDATRANYYPRLSLTGSLGSASSALANVLQNPVGTLGAGLILPFLQWNQMRLDSAISRNQYEEAVVNFRQALYQAMAEVENALAARGSLAVQGTELQASLVSAQRAEQIYEARYRAGAVALRTWLDAQERRRQAEISVSQNRYNRYLNQVTLYQALGGDALADAPEPSAQ
ncbi:efflux transporter outer membrane subunit [Pusillimonas sp. CC-YST705]|uniref:Efflux transporter outer membrane subunit n=1 Tax=Mesopusillimonas faecipullorum TaxID=2755040 RepID=A0ABS8C9S6_9BURK|nr:efflux transporter outer membrane subunit [Mesopusillimonas faecipullorum]MCB5362775.1 efflux transporter outer membrane subunit [Mesopusillimonas faecipullorum]